MADELNALVTSLGITPEVFLVAIVVAIIVVGAVVFF